MSDRSGPPEDQLIAAARAAAARAPDQPGPLFRLCCLLLEHRKPEANLLLSRLERFRAFAPGWCAVGSALLERQHAAALVAFNRAYVAAPTLQAGAGRAAALTALGRHAEAAAALQACERLAPHDARLRRQRAVALRQAGDLPAAREAFGQATQLDPAFADAWYGLGVVCQDQGDHAAAVPAFQAALEAAPHLTEAALNLGIALQETGMLDEALTAYARAWRLRADLFGRIAQALASHRVGRLWLDPRVLESELASRV